jgi:hypothetical protein
MDRQMALVEPMAKQRCCRLRWIMARCTRTPTEALSAARNRDAGELQHMMTSRRSLRALGEQTEGPGSYCG